MFNSKSKGLEKEYPFRKGVTIAIGEFCSKRGENLSRRVLVG
jgi:hypothetical protein